LNTGKLLAKTRFQPRASHPITVDQAANCRRKARGNGHQVPDGRPPWTLRRTSNATPSDAAPTSSGATALRPGSPAHRGDAATNEWLRSTNETRALVLDGFVVAPVLVGFVVDDCQDLDEAEGGPKPPQGRLLVGIQLGHSPSQLPPPRLVASGPKVQVDPATLELELVDLAFAVILTAGLESKQLRLAG
jgi:hypothetical protein